MPGGDEGMEVGHADLRDSSRGFLSHNLCFNFEDFIGYISNSSSDLYKEISREKIIYELSDPLSQKHYFFSSLDKKNDPLFTGQFAIMSEPDLAKAYKEKGLNGFKDWTHCVWEVFASTVNDEVAKDYLAIYKHQGFVF